uniref:YkvA family protein n=1 Tax=Segatella hominis TaxID=2518605 RepID=UPI004028ED05
MKTSIIDTKVMKDKLHEYAMKVGRISARPLLLLYFIMVSKDTPKSDKLLILSTISYLVFPVDLISAKRLPIIGWIDEAFSFSVAYQKVCKNITPKIERETDALLDKWFPEYTSYIEIFD